MALYPFKLPDARTPPRPGPGFVLDPRTGRWVKKSVATPARPGSADPAGALGGFTDLQRTYLETASRGPDYSGIRPFASEDELAGQAGRIATSRFQPGIDAIQAERGYQAARKKVSNQAAIAFQNALTGILQGGNTNIDDPAGQKYALENFGGSYLGGMAALIGQQLLGQIENTFNERDFALANRLDELMTKYPEEAENIYADLVKGEQERVAQGMSIVDADYKTQLGALASAIKFERENAKDRSLDEHRRRQDLLAATKALAGGGTEPRVIQTSSSTYAVDPATGKKIWEHKNPPKPADKRNPVTRKFGGATWQWNPQTGGWDLLARDPAKTPEAKADESAGVREDLFKRANDLVADGITGSRAFRALRAQFYAQLRAAGMRDPQIKKLLWQALKASPTKPKKGSGLFDD